MEVTCVVRDRLTVASVQKYILSYIAPVTSTRGDYVIPPPGVKDATVMGGAVPGPPVRYIGLHRGGEPYRESSVSSGVMTPMMMGPSVISGGTSIARKVPPLGWGNGVPGGMGGGRMGIAVRCPSHHIDQFSTPLLRVDGAPPAGMFGEVMCEGC